MLDFVQASEVCNTILVEKTDRLYRNIRDWVTLDDLGAEIHFVKESIILNDEAKSSEKFVHGIKVLMAKNYVDNLSEEASKGMLEKARQGLYPSFAPLGYLNDSETKTIKLDPERAPLIRKLFEAYATGRESFDSLVKLAYRMGLRTRKGKTLGKSAIALMMKKLTYTGDFVWNGTTYSGSYEPLISKALFEETQKRRNAVTFSKPKRLDHAFRGLVRCGHCNCMVTGSTVRQKYTYYCCTHGKKNCLEKSVPEKTLAEMLGAPLKSLKLTQERLDWIVELVKADDSEDTKKRSRVLKGLHQDQHHLEAKLDLIYDDKLTGTITKEFWKRKHDEYSVRLSWILGEIRKEEQENGDNLASVERILKLSQTAYSLYLSRNHHDQRKLLDLVLSNSTLKDKRIHTELKHPFDLIVDGALEDQAKIKAGKSILAQNENWLPTWDGKGNFF